MAEKKMRVRNFFWFAFVLIVFLVPGFKTQAALYGEAELNQAASWDFGLRFDFFNRGIKRDETTSTLKALHLVAEARGKNLGGTVNLTLFAGLGQTDLNGLVFNELPITLDYQAGRISGLIIGLAADWPLIYKSDFKLGLTADFMTWLGFKEKFAIEGFVFPGEAKAEPDWSQASGGVFATYEGYENVAPFLKVKISGLWGTFKMTENMEDLSGEEKKSLKGSGLMAISLGCYLKLTDRLYLTPVVEFYPAGKSSLAASLAIFYAF